MSKKFNFKKQSREERNVDFRTKLEELSHTMKSEEEPIKKHINVKNVKVKNRCNYEHFYDINVAITDEDLNFLKDDGQFIESEEVLNPTKNSLEIWKDIPGFIGTYQVSNKGNVRSLDRIVKSRKVYGKEFKIQKNLYVALTKDRKRVSFTVFQLMGMAFVDSKETVYSFCEPETAFEDKEEFRYISNLCYDKEFAVMEDLNSKKKVHYKSAKKLMNEIVKKVNANPLHLSPEEIKNFNCYTSILNLVDSVNYISKEEDYLKVSDFVKFGFNLYFIRGKYKFRLEKNMLRKVILANGKILDYPDIVWTGKELKEGLNIASKSDDMKISKIASKLFYTYCIQSDFPIRDTVEYSLVKVKEKYFTIQNITKQKKEQEDMTKGIQQKFKKYYYIKKGEQYVISNPAEQDEQLSDNFREALLITQEELNELNKKLDRRIYRIYYIQVK